MNITISVLLELIESSLSTDRCFTIASAERVTSHTITGIMVIVVQSGVKVVHHTIGMKRPPPWGQPFTTSACLVASASSLMSLWLSNMFIHSIITACTLTYAAALNGVQFQIIIPYLGIHI